MHWLKSPDPRFATRVLDMAFAVAHGQGKYPWWLASLKATKQPDCLKSVREHRALDAHLPLSDTATPLHYPAYNLLKMIQNQIDNCHKHTQVGMS